MYFTKTYISINIFFPQIPTYIYQIYRAFKSDLYGRTGRNNDTN